MDAKAGGNEMMGRIQIVRPGAPEEIVVTLKNAGELPIGPDEKMTEI